MVTRALRRGGLRGWHLHLSSFGGIILCISLWIRAKTVDQEMRGNAERRALFVGLWPSTLWLIGDAIERVEPAQPAMAQRRRRLRGQGTTRSVRGRRRGR